MVALAEQFEARRIPLVADPKRSPFRIYRDTRFSRDKSPYKTHIGASLPWVGGADGSMPAPGTSAEGDDDGPHGNGAYFNFQPGEMYAGGGMWMPSKPRLDAFRRALVDDPDRVHAALDDPAFVAFFGGVQQPRDAEAGAARVPGRPPRGRAPPLEGRRVRTPADRRRGLLAAAPGPAGRGLRDRRPGVPVPGGRSPEPPGRGAPSPSGPPLRPPPAGDRAGCSSPSSPSAARTPPVVTPGPPRRTRRSPPIPAPRPARRPRPATSCTGSCPTGRWTRGSSAHLADTPLSTIGLFSVTHGADGSLRTAAPGYRAITGRRRPRDRRRRRTSGTRGSSSSTPASAWAATASCSRTRSSRTR